MKDWFLVTYHSQDSNMIGGLRMEKLKIFLMSKKIKITLIAHKSKKKEDISIPYLSNSSKIHGIINFFIIPDLTSLWALKVYKFLKTKSGILITSSPPNGVHWSGYLAKVFRRDLYWIIDYRDPWTLNVSYQKSLQEKKYFHKIFLDKVLENIFFQKVDLILVNSDEDKHKHIERYPFIKKKVLTIRNGYDQKVENVSVSHDEELIFVYAGSSYGIESIESFLNAINNVNKKYKVICDYYGERHELHSTSKVLKYMGKKASEDVPVLLSNYKYGLAYMPYESINSGRILQKFYDYIGSGLIPVIINPSIEMRNLIIKLGFGVTLFETDYKIEKNLHTIFASILQAKVDTSVIEKFSRINQFDLLYQTLESM